jgi:hypothetical protein
MAKPPPKCKAILICGTAKKSKDGLYSLGEIADFFIAPRFPLELRSEHLFLYLVDGVGKYRLKVDLIEVATKETISVSPSIEHEFEDRFSPLQIVFPLNCHLPHEGSYEFVAFANNEEIDRIRIRAKHGKDS